MTNDSESRKLPFHSVVLVAARAARETLNATREPMNLSCTGYSIDSSVKERERGRDKRSSRSY